jgi:predicted nucleic acid-binding protein
MMLILDTNVISELLRAKPANEVAAWLASQDSEVVFFTAVGEAELRHGIAILPAGRRRRSLSMAIDEILEEDFRGGVLPFDGAAAFAYTEIAAERQASERPVTGRSPGPGFRRSGWR